MDTTYVNAQGVILTNTKNDARYIIKYGKENTFNEGDASNNFLRYPDVLLRLAEAIGETNEAYTFINQAGAGAKLPALSAATAGTFAKKLLHE